MAKGCGELEKKSMSPQSMRRERDDVCLMLVWHIFEGKPGLRREEK